MHSLIAIAPRCEQPVGAGRRRARRAAAARACAGWRDDRRARAAWHAYHLIGDVLRSRRPGRDRPRDEAFLVALRARLADEPVVLAPQRAPAPRRGVPWTRPPRRRAALAAGCVAAGVAVAGRQRRRPSAGRSRRPPAIAPGAPRRQPPVAARRRRPRRQSRPTSARQSADGQLIRDAAARALPGRAQAVRAAAPALGRAVGVPAQRDASTPRRADRGRAPALLLRALALAASLALALAQLQAGARGAAVARPAAQRAERRARLAAAHPRRGAASSNFRAPSSSAAAAASSSARIAHYCDGRTSTSASSRSTASRARRLPPQRRGAHAAGREPRRAWSSSATRCARFRRCCRPATTHIAELLRAAARRASERVAGHDADRAAAQAARRRCASATGSGPTRHRPAAARRRRSASTANARDVGFSDVSIGVAPQPDSGAAADAHGSTATASSSRRSTPTRLRGRRLGLQRRPCPGFQPVELRRRALAMPGERGAGRRRCCRRSTPTGSTYVSLFIEPFEPQRHAQADARPRSARRTR